MIPGFQMVNVYRGDDHFDEVASATLIPGDFILVPTGNRLMACDAVLVITLKTLNA